MQHTSTKTILITGATDGIGLATAKVLVSLGHQVLIHGRTPEKLQRVQAELNDITTGKPVETYQADLSKIVDIQSLAKNIASTHQNLDVLINNAGVFRTPHTITEDGLDIRFMVNTLAPCLLTELLLPLFSSISRVLNLSSAAQAPVNIQGLKGKTKLSDIDAYAQSKLALTIWSQAYAKKYQITGPIMIAVNPGSLLASKMVTEGFGVAGSDINIGANILTDLAINAKYADASGQYFDNDAGQFSSPHSDAANPSVVDNLVTEINAILLTLVSNSGLQKLVSK